MGALGQIVGVEPPVLGVEGRHQRARAPAAVSGPASAAGRSARSSGARSAGRRRARSAAARAAPARRRARRAPAPRARVHAASSRARRRPAVAAAARRCPTVRTNVARMSVSSSPHVESTPGRGGITTVGMSSSSASRHACSGPAPPKATSAKRRGSWPRPTDTVRMARAMELSTISTMPAAASSTPRPSGAPDARLDGRARGAARRAAARRRAARAGCGRAPGARR